ncbi:MAG: S26 family signal peptidase [Sulfuricaulis sp.]
MSEAALLALSYSKHDEEHRQRMTAQIDNIKSDLDRMKEHPAIKEAIRKCPAPRKQSQRKKWTPWFVINVTCAAFLGWVLFYTILGSVVRIGFDPQPVRCLPWRVYVIRTAAPATIDRDKIYQYYARGIPLMPEGTRVVKYAAGVPGDRIDEDADGIRINGKLWGPLNPVVLEKAHLTVAGVTRHLVIPAGKVLMLGTLPHTYDGRYFGLIPSKDVVARAYPIW